MSGSNESLIRAVIDLAFDSRHRGDQPFAALLVDASGEVRLETLNSAITGGDLTGHAEMNLVRLAVTTLDPDSLREATLYASTEPCPMCSGAIYWSRIGHVVYGLGQGRFHRHLEQSGKTVDALVMPCRAILGKGPREVKVEGPVLELEALAPHVGFW